MKTRTALAISRIEKPIKANEIPLLRFAFDKIVGPNKEDIIRKVLVALHANHDRNLRNCFALWRLLAIGKSHIEEEDELR